jgi:predicted ATPase/DNA-binding SARP family transcriptional activator
VAFAFLVLERGHPASNDQLAELLWPAGPPSTWEPSLRGLMSRIRGELDGFGLGAGNGLNAAFGCYHLQLPDDASVDIEEAERNVLCALASLDAGDPERARRAAEEAVDVLSAPFLPGAGGTWVEQREVALRELHVRALEALADADTGLGRLAEAVDAGARAVALEPLRETAHFRLMRAHAAAGNRAQALRVYEDCRDLLSEAMGVAPSGIMQRAYDALLGQDMPPPTPSPGGVTSDAPTCPNNLPCPLSTFVGRKSLVDTLQRRLRETRLLTLTGPAGIGKSRLAVELAARVFGDHRDGVFLVELASLAKAAMVPEHLLSTLSGSGAEGDSVIQALRAHVGTRRILLVLDNCEHLTTACASVAESLLTCCPNLRIVATSREPLDVPGECVSRIPPLAVPPLPPPPLPALVEYEAARLLIDRVLAADADIVLSEDDALPLAQLCNRLDGVPLALELVAPRVRALSLAEMAAHLEHGLGLLRDDITDGLAHHRTLRAAVDWTYDSLTGREQFLLDSLSVFAGGASFDAILEVCESDALPSSDLLAVLRVLVDRSLVGVDRRAPATRYYLLATLRMYGQERLAERGDLGRLHRRHLRWALRLAERAEPGLLGPDQGRWLQDLDREHENLRAALSWAMADGSYEEALLLATAVAHFWEVRGHLEEGKKWLSMALEAGAAQPPALRAKALTAMGILSTQKGDLDLARAAYEEGLVIRRSIGDDAGIATALLGLGNLAVLQGTYEEACALYEDCLRIGRELHDLRILGATLANLGSVVHRQGHLDEARALYTESLDARERLGDTQGVAECLGNLGFLALADGDCAEGRRLGERSLSLRSELGDQVGIIDILEALGTVEAWTGDLAAARTHYARRYELARTLGNPEYSAMAAQGLAEVALLQGDHREATRVLDEALGASRRAGHPASAVVTLLMLARAHRMAGDAAGARVACRQAVRAAIAVDSRALAADCLEESARITIAGGQLAHAATLFGAADELRGHDDRRPSNDSLEREIDNLRDTLGIAVFDERWAAGSTAAFPRGVRTLVDDVGM